MFNTNFHNMVYFHLFFLTFQHFILKTTFIYSSEILYISQCELILSVYLYLYPSLPRVPHPHLGTDLFLRTTHSYVIEH